MDRSLKPPDSETHNAQLHPDASSSLLQPDILQPVWGPSVNHHPLTPIHTG